MVKAPRRAPGSRKLVFLFQGKGSCNRSLWKISQSLCGGTGLATSFETITPREPVIEAGPRTAPDRPKPPNESQGVPSLAVTSFKKALLYARVFAFYTKVCCSSRKRREQGQSDRARGLLTVYIHVRSSWKTALVVLLVPYDFFDFFAVQSGYS